MRIEDTSVYLPGDIRDRIRDLMNGRGLTQAQIAEGAGCEASCISRFLCGKTDTMNYTYIIGMAKFFSVTTDFLLGLTDEPNGSAHNTIDFGKCDPESAKKLLANDNFARATYHIRQMTDSSLAEGIAAQNQLIDSMSEFALRIKPEVKELRRDLSFLKRPPYQADEELADKYFMAAVREIRQESASGANAQKQKTKEITERVTGNPIVIEQVRSGNLDPETYADAVIDAALDGMNVPPKVAEIGKKLLSTLMKWFGKKHRNEQQKAC